MPRIIIAGPSEASRTQLNRLLTASGFGVFRLCGSEGELRRTLTECEDGIVLVCAMNPDDIAAWNNLAVVYQRQGVLDEALEAAERALEAAKALKTPEVRERAVKDVGRTLRAIQKLREKKSEK